MLHRLVYKKEFPALLKVFKSKKLTKDMINQRDHRGNTPILLAAKLAYKDEDYLKCINFLFKHEANGKLRDGNGWSLMDEAIGQQNNRLLAIIFDWLSKRKKEFVDRNKKRVFERLRKVPDFYCEINWNCQSTWIPFLSKIAPSDTF